MEKWTRIMYLPGIPLGKTGKGLPVPGVILLCQKKRQKKAWFC